MQRKSTRKFLERWLRERSGRSAMLFQHLPPFEDDPKDTAFTAAAVPYGPRARLLETCIRSEVAVIACGHLHVYRPKTPIGPNSLLLQARLPTPLGCTDPFPLACMRGVPIARQSFLTFSELASSARHVVAIGQ